MMIFISSSHANKLSLPGLQYWVLSLDDKQRSAEGTAVITTCLKANKAIKEVARCFKNEESSNFKIKISRSFEIE